MSTFPKNTLGSTVSLEGPKGLKHIAVLTAKIYYSEWIQMKFNKREKVSGAKFIEK